MVFQKNNPRVRFLIVALVVAFGLGLRFLHLEKTAIFDADQENFAWTAVRLLEEQRPVLVGLKAGEFPVFIGPLMYYVYALFLWLFAMDPIGLSYFSLLVAILTMMSVFWVGWKSFSYRVGLLAVFLYAFSAYFVQNDPRVWLPGPLILVSVWIYHLLIQAEQKNLERALVLLGLLFSFGFQLHITALFFLPIIGLGLLMKGLRPDWRQLLGGGFAAFVGILPVLLFDLRHEFINLKGWGTLLTKTGETQNYWHRLIALIRFNLENEVRIFSLPLSGVTLVSAGLLFLVWLVLALGKSRFSQKLRLAGLWLIVPLVMFLPLKLHTPEYYFIISFPVLLLVTVCFLVELSQQKWLRIPIVLLLVVFFLGNLWMVMTLPTDDLISLYEKKRVVDYVIDQSQGKEFTVFYQADRGYNYGYTYLFYWRLGHIPEEQAAADFVVVTPWSYQNPRLTQRFGAIGVIDNSQK